MSSNNDPILSALEAGTPETALQLCRQRLEINPHAPDVLTLLALCEWRAGNHRGALDTYAALANSHPNDVVLWRNYATALRESGDLVAAEQASAAALRLIPDDPEWLELHGSLQIALGKPLDARNSLLCAFGKAPNSPAIRIHAAQACLACRDWRAENLLRPWRNWLPLDDVLESELAELLIKTGQADSAAELLQGLAVRLPAERSIRVRLASLYERLNRLSDAEGLLAGVVSELERLGLPIGSEVAHQQAQLAVRKHDYKSALAILEKAEPRNDGDYAHWFALANIYDKTCDWHAAMRALDRAHALQIDELKLTVPHFFEPNAEVLPDVGARVTGDDFRSWLKLRSPDASQSPVFVVGFPRSGTTLLEQMLDAHPRLQSMDERPFFNMLASELEHRAGIRVPNDLGELNQRDCDELRKGYLVMACGKVARRWDARLVDKNPLNMLWVPLIQKMFPDAKFILALRHPCDVILSCYKQNFRSAVLISAGRSLENLARAYVAAMDNWLYHVNLFGTDVFVSRYEELVADPQAQAGRIAAFLGLDDAGSMLRFATRAREKGYIQTPSYTQVIEPINAQGVGRWHHYREFLEPTLPVLQPMLDHWGYASASHGVATSEK